MFFEDRALAPYQGDEPYLFLSYSHKDSEKVSMIIRELNKNGFRVWYDEGIVPGVDWDDNVAQALVDSSYFIALISPNYTESENCRDELNYARELKKQRLLVYLEETELPPGIAMRVNQLLALHMDKYADEAMFYEKLFAADGIEVCRGKAKAESTDVAAEQKNVAGPMATEPKQETEPEKQSTPAPTTYAVDSGEPGNNIWKYLIFLIPAVILIILAVVFLPGIFKKPVPPKVPAPPIAVAELEPPAPPAEPAVLVPETSAPTPTITPEPEPDQELEPEPTPEPTSEPTEEEQARMDAEKLYEDGKTREAALAFWKLGDEDHSRALWREVADHQSVGMGNYHAVGLKSDGTVIAAGSNEYGQLNVGDWDDIVAVAAGETHTLGLKADGTVVGAGTDSNGSCRLDGWTDIIAIAAGNNTSFGLKRNGTVVAAGYNRLGQMNVEDWTDIVAIAASSLHTVGLKADGTVVAVGVNQDGQCDVSDWTDIVAIAVSKGHTIGLKADGTVVAVGDNMRNDCEVSSWKNIQSIAASFQLSIGVREDGTLIWSGQQGYSKDLSGWFDIHEIRGCSCTGIDNRQGIIGVTEFGTTIAEMQGRAGSVDDWYGMKMQ